MERKIHFRGICLYLGILGKAESILRIWGSKENTFRELRIFFQEFGEINALFSGIKGAQTPTVWGTSPLCHNSLKDLPTKATVIYVPMEIQKTIIKATFPH